MASGELLANRRWAVLAAAGFTCIFCVHYLVAKHLLRTMDVMAFAASRGVIGGLLLAALFHRQLVGLRLRAIAIAGAIGIFGFCINQLLFLHGLARSTPGEAAVLSNLIPLVATAVAILFRLEAPGRRKLLGLVFGFASVASYVAWQTGAVPWEHAVGNLFIVANVVSLALALALAKRFAAEMPGPAMTALMLLTGGIVLAALSAPQLAEVWHVTFSSSQNVAMMSFEVVISTALAYALNIYAIRILPVSTTMVFAFFQPVITGLLVLAVHGRAPSSALFPLFAAISVATYVVVTADRRDGAGARR